MATQINTEHIPQRISKYYHSIVSPAKREGIIYHSLLGNGVVASRPLIDKLNLQRDKSSFEINRLSISHELVDCLRERKLIIDAGTHEDENLVVGCPANRGRDIKHLRLCVTETCNMRCSYCHMGCKITDKHMSFDVAVKAIDAFHDLIRRHGNTAKVTFFGGEPLLNWTCVRRAIQHIRQIDPDRKYFKTLYIATNGTCLDREKAVFLRDTETTLSLSLDGPETENDRVRIMQDGGGSYRKVMHGLSSLKEVGHKMHSFIGVIGDHNMEVIQKLIYLTAKHNMSLSYHNAFALPKEISSKASIEQIADAFIMADRLAKKLGLKADGPWRWPYMMAFSTNYSKRHCMASGCEISVTPDGQIKPCPGFNDIMGTIDDIEAAICSSLYDKVYKRRAPNIADCRGCEIEGLCGGGCMVNAGIINGGDFYRKDDSCSLVRELFIRLMNDHLETLK